MQSAQVRIRLNQDNFEFLRQLADQAGLQQVDIATMLVHAAVAALKEAGKDTPFPIRFKIADGGDTPKPERIRR